MVVIRLKIPKHKNILTYLQQANTSILAPCNGKGTCGKCKILIPSNPTPNNQELVKLSQKELENGVRLACTRVTKEDTIIEPLFAQQIMEIESNYEINYLTNSYLKITEENDQFSVYRGTQLITTKDTRDAYGICIDIGTTTVVLVLFDLNNAHPIESIAFLNPQGAYGSDVISRIQYASNLEHLKILSSVITSKIDHEIKQLLDNNAISKDDLFEVVIAANTTMNHLLLGVDPTSLATAPYKSVFLDTIIKPYHEIFPSHFTSNVTILGGFDSYVGGDIVSGVYSQDLHKKDDYNILVDLGTNGEIIIANNKKMFGTSTAAGPAFEGVNIECGIGAVSGAISHFTFNQTPVTINNDTPRGICGSGLLDIVSELYKNDYINKSGYMKNKYFITEDIYLSPKDIREVQLAKSAIRAGIERLLSEANIKPKDIEALYLAGGFGKHVNLNHLSEIGIIPNNLLKKTKVIGNSSLSGAVKYLFQPLSDEVETLRKNCRIINLGTSPEFQELFIKYISF